MLQLREDLLAVSPPNDTPLDGTPVESRLLCDLRHPENAKVGRTPRAQLGHEALQVPGRLGARRARTQRQC